MSDKGRAVRRRRGWWIGAATFALLPAAIGVLIARFDPNSLKPTLVAAARNATGRALHIGGDLKLVQVLPPEIEATDVRLDNLPGGSRADMARVERVAVTLSVPALLQRRIEITRLTLVGPNILFEQVAGKPNWRFDLPEQEPEHAAAPATDSTDHPFALEVRNAVIRNGMLTWRLPARTKVLGIRSMEVQHHDSGGPIEFGGTFVYADNQPFRLTGSALPTAGLAAPWTTRLDLSAFDATASATGQMDTAGFYDLQVEAKAGALEKLNALLPEMRLPALHGVSLSSRIGNGRQPGDLPVVGATRLRFTDGDLSARAPGLKLGAFDLVIDKPGGAATVNGSGHYGAQGFTLGGTFGVPRHPDGAVEVPIDLELKAPAQGRQASGRLGVKGKLALRALVFAGLEGTGTLSTPALAALRPVVSGALPALADLRFDGHFALPAALDSVVVSDARLQSRQGDVAGRLSVGAGSPRPVSGTLRSEQLDLQAMLAAFGIDLSPPQLDGAPTGPVIPDTPIDWAVLRGPALDLSAQAERLRFGDATWQGVELGVRLRNGRLERAGLSVVSGGSPVAVTVSVDARQSPVPVSLGIDAPALPLALVAEYAGLPGPVSGAARVHARLQAAGNSLHELAGSLNGTASLAAVGGQMRNAAFVQLTKASLDALGIKVPPQGDTALRCLGIGAAFRGGVGRLSPIALETTYLSLAGEGQVDLGRETVSLQLKPLAAVSGASVSVPVVVEGPFRHVSGRLDAGVLDKLGLLVDAWFGGDRSTACVDAGLVQAPAR